MGGVEVDAAADFGKSGAPSGPFGGASYPAIAGTEVGGVKIVPMQIATVGHSDGHYYLRKGSPGCSGVDV